ncbi:serine protease 56 [Paramormyrops kingsleyae]|uniref:serine protease 56 n=1 Tax=Paramormyrops kingsleyae TaxID=1676925 RepID=UPI003B96C32D
MLLAFLLILGQVSTAPPARETYRMPASALQALSDRGTVVLEAALASALTALELAAAERSWAESSCRGCVPCLFQDCGRRSGPCAAPDTALEEPTCETIGEAQKLPDEGERNWALSQACGFYRLRCPEAERDRGRCVRVMGESCSARVLRCSLLSTIRSLELLPSPQPGMKEFCGHRVPSGQNVTQPRSRIVGGKLATPGSWPWLVNLQLDGGIMCGGVLVDSAWVVTAAHCFSGSRSENYWTVVVGEFDITKTDPEEQVMKVNRIITHPKFNPKTFNNDIALVELASPVMMSHRVSPICLPSGQDPPLGASCLVAGWGSQYEDGPSTEQVMEAKVPLLPQSTCRNALGKELLTNTMFCAGFLSGGVDSCQGDSGGPLIYQDQPSGRFQLHGITSWGDGCGAKGKPGVYTRVTAFSDWILGEMQKSSGSREPTCTELLKTSELPEEQQRSEFSSLCRFYSGSCPPAQGAAACSQAAEERCRGRLRKCQMRSFLQTLLDLLQRAEDYIRDKVDLTFFTQTLPQLVDHIYNTAYSTRKRRTAPTLPAQVGVTMSPEAMGHRPPSFFKEVGPQAGDWADFLRDIAKHWDQQPTTEDVQSLPRERSLFLQEGDRAVAQLLGEYRWLIGRLRSRLERGGVLLATATVSMSAVPVPRDPSPESHQLGGQGPDPGSGAPSTARPQESVKPLCPCVTAASGNGLPALPPFHQSPTPDDTRAGGEEVPDPVWTPATPPMAKLFPNSAIFRTQEGAHRRWKDLRERRTSGENGKACPGVLEVVHNTSLIRDMYRWVLGIPTKNLCMNFQEVLVDLMTKNEKGLYEARIRAMVGGHTLTFHCLVGLENEAFYRSMPQVIALALDALKAY